MRTTNDKKEYVLSARLGESDTEFVKADMKRKGIGATEYVKYLIRLAKKQ